MKLRVVHHWFLVSAGALLCAIIGWIPAAGALQASLAARGAWGCAIAAVIALGVYARTRRPADAPPRSEAT